ncbi:hypothetical protein HPP92_027185 [Vanilla planifolia]|uniref:Uncharacterized protein n=1 Tax=Vanilla planifolia TaxID=51239 RepID=A0A835PDE9_VANPL|nr:hypothetical protein HPP92_027185 [Vanilla planifolia]
MRPLISVSGGCWSASGLIDARKMFVGGLGEASPEAKAAKNLQHFFTFVALKIVLAQLQVKH